MKIHSIVSMFILAGCLLGTSPAGAVVGKGGRQCYNHNNDQGGCDNAGCSYNSSTGTCSK